MNLHQIHSLPKCEAGEFYVYPRTVNQAFPTHQNLEIYTKYEPMSKADEWVTTVSAIGFIALIVFAAKGWI